MCLSPISGPVSENVDEGFPRWLRVKEAALAADVSIQTIYRRVREGSVPAIRVGANGPIRIDADAFRDWLFGEQREAV